MILQILKSKKQKFSVFDLFFNKAFLSSKKKVFLFGGQGNQQIGMIDKFLADSSIRNLIQNQGQKLGIDFVQIATKDSKKLMNLTQYTQPLLLLSQYLQFFHGQKTNSLSQNINGQITYCIGHSLGQYSAHLVAGSITLSECLKLVFRRGQLMMKASQNQNFGTLIIKYRQDKQKGILNFAQKLGVEVACYNSPTNMLISGYVSKITQLKVILKQQLRIVSKLLPVSTAFHCKYLEKMNAQFKRQLESVSFQPPKFKILRNIDCKIYQSKQDIVEGLLLQNTRPVLFMNQVNEVIRKQGKQNLEFIQIGHKQYLNRWVDEVKKLY